MLKQVENENKILKFKQRHEEFIEWLETVKKENFSDASNVDSAVMLWVEKDKKGEMKTYQAHFRMSKVDDFEYMQHCIANYVLEQKFENYLIEHIGDFLEYVNE